MEFFINSISCILFLPLWAILMIMLNASIPFVASKKLTLNLTLASTGIGFVFSVFAFLYCLQPTTNTIEYDISWLNVGDFAIYFGTLIDNLSSLMLLIVTFISFFIQLFSYGYMKDDSSFHRYFIYLNLFNFSMLGLVISSNLVQTYVFWELVGLCSYLLIGFWYKKQVATDAAKKAFLVNRLGDVGLLLGIILLLYLSISFNVSENTVLLSFSGLTLTAEQVYSMVPAWFYGLICLLLFMGSIAKSAQFPLHVWLKDAMEAPTPVSALIHAATMVAAGVYLVARLYPVYSLSNFALDFIAYVGIITAVLTAYFAMSQNDIKKVLAYSTSSQLGLMFVGLGVGAFSGALFHLTVHAFSKALLFLCAGYIMHSVANEKNMKFLGALRSYMPLCAFCYLIGALSLSGLFFSGFFSKEAIFSKIYDSNNFILIIGFCLVAFMTAFYMFRSYFLTFEGEKRNNYEIYRNSWSMKLPLIALALPSAFLGVFLKHTFPNFVYFISPETEFFNLFLIVISLTFAAFGVFFAFMLYVMVNNSFMLIKEQALNKDNLPYKLSFNGLYLDNIYRWFINEVLLRICRILNYFEKYVIDGLVTFVALLTRFVSFCVSKLQNGCFQSYLNYSVLIIAFLVFLGGAMYFIGFLNGG